MDRETYDRLVEEIYDSVLDPTHWDITLEKIRLEFNSMAAGFFTQSADNQLLNYYIRCIDPNEVDVYARHFSHSNPWFVEPGLMQPGRVLSDRSLEKLHQDTRFFVRTEFYQEWLKPQEFRHSMGGTLLDDSGNKLNFTFFRSHHSGYYSQEEGDIYKSLSQHLMKAVALSQQLQSALQQNAARETLIDRLTLGVVMLDRPNHIVYQNPYAARIFNREHLDNELVQEAILKAFKQQKSSLVPVERAGKKSLSVCILPNHQRVSLFAVQRPMVQLVITDPEDREVSSNEMIVKRWRLTELEAKIALLLVRGQSLREIADQLQLKLSTVQWYNKQIMQKLGVRRQAELCMVLMKDAMLTHI